MLTPRVESRAVLDAARFDRVPAGERVQDAFPGMSPADRELYFVSGTCGSCWDGMFGTAEQ